MSDDIIETFIRLTDEPEINGFEKTKAEALQALARERTEAARLRAMIERTYCAYCGQEYPIDDQAATQVSRHIRTCEKHPMRAVEAEAARLREENAALRETFLEQHKVINILRVKIAALRAELRERAEALPPKVIEAMRNNTDLFPWYWLSYGEKCYAFAVVSAFQVNEGDPLPKPGTELEPHPDKERVWVGENGTEMLVEKQIAAIEEQSGDTVCRFIAAAHACFLGDDCIEANLAVLKEED